jgi:flagellar biosynthesis protein FliR
VFTIDVMAIAGVSARTFGMLISLPTGDALQTLPRLLISVLFGWAVASTIQLPTEVSALTLALEFMVGFLIAAPLRFLSDAAEMFGEVIDTARGQTIGSVVDPLNGQQGSDMANILRVAVVVLAIQLGGFDRCVEALRASYTSLPLGGVNFDSDVVSGTLRQGLGIVSAALSLSAVWLTAYLAIDLACALMSKVCTGLQFTSTSTLLKMIITFILLLNLLNKPTETIKLIASQTHPVSLINEQAETPQNSTKEAIKK